MDRNRTPRAGDVFGLLVRHFFGRFFDKESLSPQGEPEAGVIQTLGILAAPGAFFVLLFRPLSLAGWSLVAVRYIFVSYSMIVMGFVMVFEWDALFPDRRDYQILAPQPLRLWSVFAAKAVALGAFLGIFLLDINFFAFLFWPGVDGGKDVAGILWAHVAATLAAGLFSAVAIAALHGVLVTFLRGAVYRRVSVAVQTLLMAVLVMLLFLTPLLGFRIQALARVHSPWLERFPPFWFIGLYESLRPATKSLEVRALGEVAVYAMWIAAAVFVLTFLPGYRGHARRVLEAPAPGAAGPGRLRAAAGAILRRMLLRDPVQRALFGFISITITRSMKHRLFLATYGGFGAAMAVLELGPGPGAHGSLALPLMLSFILVSGLRAAFNFPSELRANWGFQLTETAGLGPYLAATRKWIFACALAPLFTVMFALDLGWHAPLSALYHAAYGLAFSLLLVEILFFGFRKAPFTCAHFPGKVNLTGLAVVYIFGFTAYSGWMAALEARLERYPAAALAFVAAVGAAALATAWLDRRRRAAGAALDYEDEMDPLIRTLGITVQ
jgi:hypothetical protein